MSESSERREEAEKRLQVADHLLSVTHSLVDDPKLLLTIMENLYYSMEGSMDALLYHEKGLKNVPAVPESFGTRMELLQKVAEKHGVKENHMKTLENFRQTLGLHEDAKVEFKRGDKFVIADDDYDLDTLSPERVKNGVEVAKDFLKTVSEVVEENDRIVGRSRG